MKPQIDYKSLLLICSCLDEILRQKDYAVENLDKAEKDISKDKAIISLDTLVELQEFLGEDLPKLIEKTRNYAKKMENKLREYKAKNQDNKESLFIDTGYESAVTSTAANIRKIAESKNPILIEDFVNYIGRYRRLKYYYPNEEIKNIHIKQMEQYSYELDKNKPPYDIFTFKDSDSVKILTGVFYIKMKAFLQD